MGPTYASQNWHGFFLGCVFSSLTYECKFPYTIWFVLNSCLRFTYANNNLNFFINETA